MLRGWLRNRRERKVQAARLVWARERAEDLTFARQSYRAYTGQMNPEDAAFYEGQVRAAEVLRQNGEMSALIDQIMTEESPEAAFLRSMFGDGFLEAKQAETKKYVADLRARADEEEADE